MGACTSEGASRVETTDGGGEGGVDCRSGAGGNGAGEEDGGDGTGGGTAGGPRNARTPTCEGVTHESVRQ